MATFLERCQNGEHEQVWAGLTALGPSVRNNLYLADAQAVAGETMRRARHNVETPIVRLQELGYEFRTQAKDVSQRAKHLDQAMVRSRPGPQELHAALGSPELDVDSRAEAETFCLADFY
jgi:hypothetical protein